MITDSSMAFLFLALLSMFSSPSVADPLFHTCGNTGNFNRNNSIYSANLNLLFSILSSNGSTTGFATFITGSIPDRISGLTLCRGDTNIAICRLCISTAISDIQQLCPNNKDATIWYDYCQLRYSNKIFLYAPDVIADTSAVTYDTESVSDDQLSRFEVLTPALMGNISDLAVRNTSRLFATGEMVFTAGNIIYGLVQCARVLSVKICRTCLQAKVDQITGDTLKGKRKGMTFGIWCNIRYGFYKFYSGTSMLYLTSGQPPSTTNGTSTPNSTRPQVNSPPGGKRSHTTKAVLMIILPVAFTLALLCIFGILALRRKRAIKRQPTSNLIQRNTRNTGSLLFDLDTIRKATNDFSEENKLGEGGFGPVYKGLLDDGQHIAVKRLSRTSTQGFLEMKNEIALVAKLLHKNLVRLLGCCLEHDEKMLVYEYLPKTSLDKYLFDPTERTKLDWGTRYKIIEGVGRGLLYLHEDSRLKIIHRDLKASNILLDNNMMPKISDFGLARLCLIDQTQQNTNRIVGTFGYMPPEYIRHGHFSTKYDVFSYGVLILEIITGMANGVLTNMGHVFGLPSYVWKYWNKGTSLQVVDQYLGHENHSQQVLRCLQIVLLCVQEDSLLRPSMASVMVMISSSSTTIPAPLMPPFYFEDNSNKNEQLIIVSANFVTITDPEAR